MNSIYGRPRRNPNRWMINHVPVMKTRPRGDYWIVAVSTFVLVVGCVWFAWALRLM